MELEPPEPVVLTNLLQTAVELSLCRAGTAPEIPPWCEPKLGSYSLVAVSQMYGYKGKRSSSSLFAVLVLLKKNNNTIVPSKITLVSLFLPLENLKTEK